LVTKSLVEPENHAEKKSNLRYPKEDEGTQQEGLTYKEIGRRLGVSTATVSLYVGERRKSGILEGLRRRLRRLT
jgi:DNA-directed RNA polymerase specialized sigma subunit